MKLATALTQLGRKFAALFFYMVSKNISLSFGKRVLFFIYFGRCKTCV